MQSSPVLKYYSTSYHQLQVTGWYYIGQSYVIKPSYKLDAFDVSENVPSFHSDAKRVFIILALNCSLQLQNIDDNHAI